MPLPLAYALSAQGATVALGAELKTIAHFSGSLFHQTAALSVGFPRRTNRLAFLNVDLKIRRREAALLLRSGQSRADELPALGSGLHQFLRGHIRRIYILHRRLL